MCLLLMLEILSLEEKRRMRKEERLTVPLNSRNVDEGITRG